MIPQVPNVSQSAVDGAKFTRHWNGFFRDLIGSFASGTWTPEFSGLSVVGSYTVDASYTRSGQVAHYSIVLTPTGVGTTASVFGDTYVVNLPFEAIKLGSGLVLTTNLGTLLGPCFVVNSSRILKLPTWAATNNTIAISGSYQIGS